MQTPEEMAKEYADTITTSCCGTSDMIITAEKAFQAGYTTALEQLPRTDKVVAPKKNWVAVLEAMQFERDLIDQAIRWAKTTPSASERCNQCAVEGYKAGYITAQPQWISVNDRLPKENELVLFCGPSADDYFVGYRVPEGVYYDPEGQGMTALNILRYCNYWMPLPPAPKEEK
jgi:hypothetical protein